MNIKEKLNLLTIAKNKFEVSEDRKDNSTVSYEISHLQADLAAMITVSNGGSNTSISYYRTNCYNSGIEWLNIDTIALEELKTFCKFLVEEA